jgi:hypothetical protein
MFFWTIKLNKRTAVGIVLAVAAVLIALIFLFGHSEAEGAFRSSRMSRAEERISYLAKLGWEVDPESEVAKTVLVPRDFTGVYADYNKLQKEQGFDLELYRGAEIEMYCYNVTNYPTSDTVLATLYVAGGKVVAGDIHSTALDGFMHGLK